MARPDHWTLFALLLAPLLCLAPGKAAGFPSEISTYAGNGSGGDSGDGGPAIEARIQEPASLAFDSAGNLYFADTENHRIKQVNALTGIITSIAGNGSQGFSGDGGPAIDARLRFPLGLAIDGDGNVYIADTDNHRVRVIDVATGIIDTFAGNGAEGDDGDGGLAAAAQLNEPKALAIDASGRLAIADSRSHRIRRVNLAGIISTIAGNGDGGYAGDGELAIDAKLSRPSGIAYDVVGDLYIADTDNDRIRKVNMSIGTIRTFAGNGTSGYSGDGAGATDAKLRKPVSVAVDANRHLLIADLENHRIRRVEHGTGLINTIAGTGSGVYDGDGVPATNAGLRNPHGVAINGTGDVFIADSKNDRIRRVEDPPFTTCGDGTLEIGEHCDDGNVFDGDCCSAGCRIEKAGTPCRLPTDLCDATEFCDGLLPVCPADLTRNAGEVCRPISGDCDLHEVCDGVLKSCPDEQTKEIGEVCREAGGDCDIVETCDGGTQCPADLRYDDTQICRPSLGGCDPAETCNGVDTHCPEELRHGTETVCRPAADLCDVAELCTGDASTCPSDVIATAGTTCRSKAGFCDIAETCDGQSIQCGPDVLVPAGVECLASTDPGCDPAELCTGQSALCPSDLIEPNGTLCDDGDALTTSETCFEGMCGCLGGDLDSDEIPDSCDIEDVSGTVQKLSVKWGRVGRGQVVIKGSFTTGILGPLDVLDTTGGLTFVIEDDDDPGYVRAEFLPEECGTSVSGRVKCKTIDKRAKASFKRKKIDTGVFTYNYSFKISRLDLQSGLTAPVRVSLTTGVIDRVGFANFCIPKTTGLRCRGG